MSTNSLTLSDWQEPAHDSKMEEQIVERILKAYPNLKLGERMSHPVALATPDGVLIEHYISGQVQTVTARAINITLPLEDTITMKGLEVTKYIHSYKTHVFNNVIVRDDYFQPVEPAEYVSYVTFRFGVSGYPEPTKIIEVNREELQTISTEINNAVYNLRQLKQSDIRMTSAEHQSLTHIDHALNKSSKTVEQLLKIGVFSL